MTAHSKPHPLTAPLDVSKIKDEKGVKKLVNRLLDFHGYFHWMPPANGYGTLGVHDVTAFKEGVFVTVEAKFGRNRPSPLQAAFAAQIIVNDGFSFCVNERNIDHLAYFLESFEVAKQHQMRELPVPEEHGARMLNAISVLTDMFDLPEDARKKAGRE